MHWNENSNLHSGFREEEEEFASLKNSVLFENK